MSKKKSLLPGGITGVSGKFSRGDTVDITDRKGKRIAKGLVNFTAGEVERIKGLSTKEIETELGYRSFDEVVGRDNLIIA